MDELCEKSGLVITHPQRANNMWLAVDIGNSGLKGGWFECGRLIEVFRVDGFESEDPAVFEERLRRRLEVHPVERAGIISVVPKATTAVTELFREKGIPSEVLHIGTSSPITMGYETPDTLGIDRFAAAAAGFTAYGKGADAGRDRPVIVVDAGTAITYEVVDRTGTYLGGLISPGPRLLRESLGQHTAQLPTVPLDLPEHPIGQSTTTAIQAGILYSCIDGINGTLDRLIETVDGRPVIVLTGGWTELLAPHLSTVDHVDPSLVLKGIYALMAPDNEDQDRP